MSVQPTYEELTKLVGTMKVQVAEIKDEMKDKKEAMDKDEHKEMESSFKQAKKSMKEARTQLEKIAKLQGLEEEYGVKLFE